MALISRTYHPGALNKLTAVILYSVLSLATVSVEAEPIKCARCHGDKIIGKYVHGPVAVEQCMTCHSVTGKPHPGSAAVKLTRTNTELCTFCHEISAVKKSHRTVASSRKCTSCH